MAKGVRIVDSLQIVQDVDHLFIAYGGQSMEIGTGFVADAGVVRQFWPKDTINTTGITWTADSDLSYSAVSTPDTAKAICNFDARTGMVIVSDPAGSDPTITSLPIRYIQAIAPAPRGQGGWLYKFEVTAGDVVTHFPDTDWHDVLEEGTLGVFENYLLNDGSGLNTGSATLSFAVDDGAGSPETGTIISKTIDFKAEVLSNRVCMTTQEWTLSNTEVNEVAEAIIVVVPDQWYDPVNQVNIDPLITGEFGHPKGVQEVERYACSTWSPVWTVQLDQISGDAVLGMDGEALGTALSTDTRRRWALTSQLGESKSAVVDVTISDGEESVTKRVNLITNSTQEGVDPGSGIDPDWTQTDAVHDQGVLEASIGVYFYNDGTMNVTTLNGGQEAGYPINWHLQAPNPSDPQNYEMRIYVNQNDSLWPDTAKSIDLWFNGWQNLSSTAFYVSDTDTQAGGQVTKDGTWIFAIREVGRPDTVKYKTLQVSSQVTG